MSEMSKLQIRAKVLTALSTIKTSGYNDESFTFIVEQLKDIDDKKFLFDILIKEYIKMSEDEYVFTACLIKELVTDTSYVEEKCLDFLKSSIYSDDAKYKIVQLLRVMGAEFDYNSTPEYFDNPADVIDSDTKKLLERAVFNPEAMLDFLDFISAVPDSDRKLLLNSLKEDYQGDTLANIVYPILYSDFEDSFKLSTVEILVDAKSSLAIAPLNYLIETSDNPEIVSACRTGLKKLKLSGASESIAKEYYLNIIKDTTPAPCYATIPDGNANQAILISRLNNKTEKFMFAAIVINDNIGVVDCFGFFNISGDELSQIISKFIQSDGKYKISPEYAKTRIDEACSITIHNKNRFPYEFTCWNVITKDILPYEGGIETQIRNNIVAKTPSKDDVLTLLTKDYSFRWYIKPSENVQLAQLIQHIYDCENLSVDYINSLIKEYEYKIFDSSTFNIWKSRIIQCIYLLQTNSKNEDSDLFYLMLNNEEYMQLFKRVIIQRSIFNYFHSKVELAKESILTANIFRKKQIQSDKQYEKKSKEILDLLAGSWIHE